MPFNIPSTSPFAAKNIDFRLGDYLELVDATGRLVRKDKRGAITETMAPMLERLQLTRQGWIDMVSGIEKKFYYAIGQSIYLKEFIPSLSHRKSKCLDFVDLCYLELAA